MIAERKKLKKQINSKSIGLLREQNKQANQQIELLYQRTILTAFF